MLAILAGVGVTYGALWFLVPGFSDGTHEGLAVMGITTRAPGAGGSRAPARDGPGRRPLIERDGRTLLWGGPDESQHFDITTFRLEPMQLHFGLGREHFHALVEPAFITVAEVEAGLTSETATTLVSATGTAAPTAAGPRTWLHDNARVLVATVGDEVKIYPLQILRRHEVVNDVVGGVPVFAAYCYLADLAAIYDRRFGDRTLTFGVSGYTYADPDTWEGRDAFVLWDRDTESLWWPPISVAVSGPLIDTPLEVLDPALWIDTTWGEAREAYPDAVVLDRGQTMPGATRP
jgi:hypothetical protein